MTTDSYVLAIDQGTTGTAALLVDAEGRVIARVRREIRQIYPQPGWVEHDPEELFQSSVAVVKEALAQANVPLSAVRGIGITNQRETTVVWEKATGRPVANAIVWQCRRTAPLCEALKSLGLEAKVREKTGLPIDAYFSATKLRWLLHNTPNGQRRAERGDLLFGTVDTWLAWRLTGGAAHVTDYSNASRTMLYNIGAREWDAELLATLKLPEVMLPRVIPSSHVYGQTLPGLLGEGSAPLAAIAGDQQAALFGQACFSPGDAKNTYGTGAFVLMNIGGKPVASKKGLVTTLAWGLGGQALYALEGSVFISGAAVQWLRDGLGLISTAAESESLARSVPDNGGVYFVPALAGLGAPHWDMYARGVIVGITRGTTRGHLARATLEAIAYQVKDVVDAMRGEAGLNVPALRVDGGGAANSLLMQFQADILGMPVQRAAVLETTALGAAYLAGLATGVWKHTSDVSRRWRPADTYDPKMSSDQRESLYADWKRAVERARGWAKE